MYNKSSTNSVSNAKSDGLNTDRTRTYHPENIIPNSKWIWVFGAEEGGKHSKGAAKIAHVNFRAHYGCDSGPTANAYAVTSQDKQHHARPIAEIAKSVDQFLSYAKTNPKFNFFVTRIGFVEGLTDREMGLLFKKAPGNCSLPEVWKPYISPDAASNSETH